MNDHAVLFHCLYYFNSYLFQFTEDQFVSELEQAILQSKIDFEADHGSNPSGMITNYKDAGDGENIILNGAKMWISNSPVADIAVVWAKDEAGEAGGKKATYHLLGRVQHVGHESGKGSTHPTVSRIPSLHTPKMLIPNLLFHE